MTYNRAKTMFCDKKLKKEFKKNVSHNSICWYGNMLNTNNQ